MLYHSTEATGHYVDHRCICHWSVSALQSFMELALAHGAGSWHTAPWRPLGALLVNPSLAGLHEFIEATVEFHLKQSLRE